MVFCIAFQDPIEKHIGDVNIVNKSHLWTPVKFIYKITIDTL